MDRHWKRQPGLKQSGCGLSEGSLRRSALWFIATTFAVKVCQSALYQPKPPGLGSKCPELIFERSAAALQTSFTTAATSCKFSSTSGNTFPPIQSEKTTCGFTRTGLRMSVSLAKTETRPLRLDWISSSVGYKGNIIFRSVQRCEEPSRRLRGALETSSRSSFSLCLIQKTKRPSWMQFLEASTSNRSMTKHPPRFSMATRPEEAVRGSKIITTRAFHVWWMSFRSCSGPNAGGGQATELRLALAFPRLFTFMSKYDRSADARVGGVFGRYPPEVQCFDTPLLYSNTNHNGPRINKGTPQGNPHVRFHDMLNELRSNKYHHEQLGKPPRNPRLPLLGLLAILLARLTLSLTPRRLPSKQWCTIRKCPGQYRRIRGARARGIKDSPCKRQQPRTARRTGGSHPHLLFVLLLLILLHSAQAAPRSRSALKPPRKLAFLRARAHSQTCAQVPYRGRLHEASTLGTTRHFVTTPATSRKAKPSLSRHGLRVVTWNSGGLHPTRWAELLQWLQDEATQNRPVHICLVQETHWTSSSEFTDSSWVCVHSSTGSREGGVLATLNKCSFKDCPVKLAELSPGRLQHIRIGTTPPIDLLNVYQYAWNPAKKELQRQSPIQSSCC